MPVHSHVGRTTISRGKLATMAAAVVTAAALSPLTVGVAPASNAASAETEGVWVRHAQQVLQQVNDPRTDVMTQAAIAANPATPHMAVAVSEEGKSRGASAGLRYAWTENSGATWHRRTLRGLTVASGGRWDSLTWSTVATGVGDEAYIASAVQAGECETAVAVARSTNGGRHFGTPLVNSRSKTCWNYNAKTWIAVDTGSASPYRGRVYLSTLVFHESHAGDIVGLQQFVRYSDDHGRTWSRRVALTGVREFTHFNSLVVHPSGAVTVVYGAFELDDPPNVSDIVAQTSHDGGRSFGPPALVTRNVLGTIGTADTRCCMPVAAVDPVTGVIYVPLGDRRFHEGDINDVLVFRSRDGAHWGEPIVANPGQDKPLEHFSPSIGAYYGRVYAVWTLRRATSNAVSDYVRQQVAVSVDGGNTYSRPVTIGRVGDMRFAAPAPNGFAPRFLSDYNTTVAVPGRGYTVWPLPTDVESEPPHQTLWAATVSPD